MDGWLAGWLARWKEGREGRREGGEGEGGNINNMDSCYLWPCGDAVGAKLKVLAR